MQGNIMKNLIILFVLVLGFSFTSCAQDRKDVAMVDNSNGTKTTIGELKNADTKTASIIEKKINATYESKNLFYLDGFENNSDYVVVLTNFENTEAYIVYLDKKFNELKKKNIPVSSLNKIKNIEI